VTLEEQAEIDAKCQAELEE
jgi:hypothetical protein